MLLKLSKNDQRYNIPLNKNLFHLLFQYFFAMQLTHVHIILLLVSFLFSTISSLNEQLNVVRKCLPRESFMDIAYILNRDLNSDQKLIELASNLVKNITTFQIKR